MPTEKDGKPYYKPLMSVLNKISKIKRDNKNPPNSYCSVSLVPYQKLVDKKIIPFFKRKNLKVGENN